MRMRGWLSIVAPALLASLALASRGETLYAATLRDGSNSTAEGEGGALFTVNPANGAYKLVAPLRIGGKVPVGLTGLSIHPRTGVFFGITAGNSANIPRSLVTVDPASGHVKLVGSLGHVGSDIRFDTTGVLYIWLTDVNSLGIVDVGTGGAQPLTEPKSAQTLGGGIAFDRNGRLYFSVNTSAGTLDSWQPGEALATVGPIINGAPFVSAINSMAFSSEGALYAVNSNLGSPAKARLVTIDVRTGAVTEIGALPADVDPIAFTATVPAGSSLLLGRPLTDWAALAGALVIGLVLGRLMGRRRQVERRAA